MNNDVEMQNIVNLVNYQLKKNQYFKIKNVTITNDYFFNLNAHISNRSSDLSFKQKEIIRVHVLYYEFFKNSQLLTKFAELNKILLSIDSPLNEKNLIFTTFLTHFNNEKLLITFCASLILRILIVYSPVPSDHYGHWKNSDYVLNEFANNITNYLIYHNVNLPVKTNVIKYETRALFLKIMEYLCDKGIIFRKIIDTHHMPTEDASNFWNQSENAFKTIKFWSLGIDLNYFNSFLYLKVSYIKYEIMEYDGKSYQKGIHFSQLYNICGGNWYSKEKLIFKNKSFLNSVLNLKIYVDVEYFEKIIKLLRINGVDLFTIEGKISNLSKEMFILTNLSKPTKIDILNIAKIQKEVSKDLHYYYLKLLWDEKIDKNKPVYIPLHFDFRGRLYYDSLVSVTNSKIARFIFCYGNYSAEEVENAKKKSQHPKLRLIIEKFIKEIDEIKKIYNIDGFDFVIFWLLISIGKLFINKAEIKIPITSFVEKGTAFLKNELTSENLDLIEKIELNHYKTLLISLTEKTIKKKVVLKDATASVVQNLIRLLGPKNQESLNIANMGDSEHWYDTYSYILSLFINSLDEDKKNSPYLEYFKRKTIKKTIMTIPYAAKERTCYAYFCACLKEMVDEPLIDKGLQDFFKLFYNFVKNNVELNFLYKNKSENLIAFALSELEKTKAIRISDQDAQTNLTYYRFKQAYLDLVYKIFDEKTGQIENKRTTKKIKKLTSDIHTTKIKSSIRANWIHFMDANFLRRVSSKLNRPLLTIHDCFLIDFLSIPDLIIAANEVMEERVCTTDKWDNSHEFEIFSIFILL